MVTVDYLNHTTSIIKTFFLALAKSVSIHFEHAVAFVVSLLQRCFHYLHLGIEGLAEEWVASYLKGRMI